MPINSIESKAKELTTIATFLNSFIFEEARIAISCGLRLNHTINELAIFYIKRYNFLMAMKGCAFLLVLLLLAVLAYSLLTSDITAQIGVPTFSIPTLGSIGTLPPIIASPMILTPGTNSRTATSTGPDSLTTITPGPPQNGRILFLGFDQTLWSTNSDGTGALQLGYYSGFQLSNNNKWYSPNGQFILLSRRENNQTIAYLTSVDGSRSLRIAQVPQNFDVISQHDLFGFSNDSQLFFFIDPSTNPANLIIADLPNFYTFSWPIQASMDEISFAAFVQYPGESNSQLVLKAFDPAINGHYLEMFNISTTLTNPRRLVELRDHRIEQFSVSPNGRFLGIIYRNSLDSNPSDELFAFDLVSKKQVSLGTPLPPNSGSRILLANPAWASNNQFLLANTWINNSTQNQPLATFQYDLISYNLISGSTESIFGGIPSPAVGLPMGRAFSYSPDGLIAGIHLYGSENTKSIDYYRVQLDGSQTLKIAAAIANQNYYEGQYVPAIASDWSRMLLISPSENPSSDYPNTGILYSTWLDGNGRVSLDSSVPLVYFDFGPVLSPDSKLCAYLRINSARNATEFVVSGLDGSNKRVLFTSSTPSQDQIPAGLPLVWLTQR